MEAQKTPGKKMLLGEILLERGLVTKQQLDQALRVQVGGMRRLGSILIAMKVIGSENLTEALSTQFKLPIVKVEEEFRDEVKGVLPRYLCRKYSVLPLSRESNNVLRLAMADPLDSVAISDVENYTGSVVQPVLARFSDIDREIPHRLPLSRQDFFNPLVYRYVAKGAVAAAAVLLLATGAMVYRQVQEQRQKAAVQEHGTKTVRSDGSMVFSHQDLTVDLARNGSVFFSGRGAHADSYYGIRFEHPDQLLTFVEGTKGQFSGQQIEWVRWVIDKQLKATNPSVLAKSG